ncbi:MAG: hypothetical protein WC157_01225 [Candidatus Paceibacterota bacterium]
MKRMALLKKSVLRVLGCFLLTKEDLQSASRSPAGCASSGYSPNLGQCMEMDGQKWYFVKSVKRHRQTYFAYKVASFLGERVLFERAYDPFGYCMTSNWVGIWISPEA